jgi:hypothetical protein
MICPLPAGSFHHGSTFRAQLHLVFALGWPSDTAELEDVDWRIVGVIDMDGNGKPDLVWQNVATGGLAVWFMDGIRIAGRYLNPETVSDPNWRIVGVK